MFRFFSTPSRILLCAASSSTVATPTRASWAAESSSAATWDMMATATNPSSSEQEGENSSSGFGSNHQTLLKHAPDVDSVLEAVRQDSGETAKYYADKYFDGSEVKVNSILWNTLKKFGHVDIDRSIVDNNNHNSENHSSGGGSTNQARWFPAANFPRRGPRVGHYREEDNDLSVLKELEAEEAEKAGSILDSTQDSNYDSNSKSDVQDDINFFNTKSSAFGSEMEANKQAVPDVMPAPAEVGWGNMSNISKKARSEGFKSRERGSGGFGGGGAPWGMSSGTKKTAEQRWKADITKLQQSAIRQQRSPAPWN